MQAELKSLLEFSDIPSGLEVEAHVLIQQALSETCVHPEPFLIHLCGIPGSGKTTFATALYPSLPAGTYYLGFDRIMESMPAYQRDLAQVGLVAAFTTWELPARIIGYHVLTALIAAGRSVLFDHSASFPRHVPLMTFLRERGYRADMYHLTCSLSTAMTRVEARERLTKRHTPRKYLEDREALLATLIPQYQAVVSTFKTVRTDTPVAEVA